MGERDKKNLLVNFLFKELHYPIERGVTFKN